METLTEIQTRLTQFVAELAPQADLSPGSVLQELVIKLSAVVQADNQTKLNALAPATSIAEVTASSVDTYSEVMDRVASNYHTYRDTGAKSTGLLRVYISTNRGYSLPQTIQFRQENLDLLYEATAQFDVRTDIDADDISAGLLVLHTQEEGLYYFMLPVVATEAGQAYQLSNQTKLSLATPNYLPDFVEAVVYGSFTSGKAKQTDKQLIQSCKRNLNNAGLASPAAIFNHLTQLYPNLLALSAVGANDSDMLRSKQNWFGVSSFGMADLYVRTSMSPELFKVVKVGRKTAEGVWRIDLLNTDCPGFYRVSSVRPVLNDAFTYGGTLVVTNTTYGSSIYTDLRNNVLPDVQAARFTKYQTCTLTITYNEPTTAPVYDPALSDTQNTANGSLRNFALLIGGQAQVADIQDYLLRDTTRVLAADYLVKAVVPCYVSLHVKLVKRYSSDTLETIGVPKLKQAIFNYVNSIPFGESLHASDLVNICHDFPIRRVDLPITMTGEVYTQTGEVVSLQDTDILEIPSLAEKGVSPRTAMFFIDYFKEYGTEVVDSIGVELV